MRAMAIALVLSLAGGAHAVDVTECGQFLRQGEVGELVGDLDCSGVEVAGAVITQAGVTLRLNGHSIIGGTHGVTGYPGNRGGPLTRIEGPGTITGATRCGLSISGKVLVTGVTLSGNDCGLQAVYGFPATLEDVVISGNTGDGIGYISRVGSGKVKARNLTVTGNGGAGIRTEGTVLLRDSEVAENGEAGVVSTRKRLVAYATSLTGNGAAGDVATYVRPKLVSSPCDHSVDLKGGGTFGLCALD